MACSSRAPLEKTTVAATLERYQFEVIPTKKATTQCHECARTCELIRHFRKYAKATTQGHGIAPSVGSADERMAIPSGAICDSLRTAHAQTIVHAYYAKPRSAGHWNTIHSNYKETR